MTSLCWDTKLRYGEFLSIFYFFITPRASKSRQRYNVNIDFTLRFLAVGGEDDAITLLYKPTSPPPSTERSPLATTGNRAAASAKMAKRKAPEDEVKKGKRNKSAAERKEQKDALLKFCG